MKTNNINGQALTETVILLPALALLFCFIVSMSDFVITHQQLLAAARYGTDLVVHSNFSEEQVKEELTNYLTGQSNKGRCLSQENLSFNIKINSFPIINQWSTEGNYFNLIKDLIADPMKYNASVEIKYKLQIFPWIAKITGDQFLYVTARSEVLDGTGSQNNHS